VATLAINQPIREEEEEEEDVLSVGSERLGC